MAPADEVTVTAEMVLAAIRAEAGDDELERYRNGKRHNDIVDFNLASKAGFKTVTAFWNAAFALGGALYGVRSLSRSSLQKYGAVARNFSEQEVSDHGMDKLSVFLTYRKVARIDTTVSLAEVRLQVPGKDGVLAEKPFAGCTVRDIRGAISHLRGPKPSLPDQDAQTIERLEAAIDEVIGSEHSGALKARSSSGGTLVTLQDVPLEHLSAVLEAMQRV